MSGYRNQYIPIGSSVSNPLDYSYPSNGGSGHAKSIALNSPESGSTHERWVYLGGPPRWSQRSHPRIIVVVHLEGIQDGPDRSRGMGQTQRSGGPPRHSGTHRQLCRLSDGRPRNLHDPPTGSVLVILA